MSDRNQEVFEAVLGALRHEDEPSRDELLEIATEIDPELEDLSGPEFQGRYYLPALNRLRSEAAEDVLCPYCGGGPYGGPKSLALHRRFCSSWDEEDGEPVSGERAYRRALDRDLTDGPDDRVSRPVETDAVPDADAPDYATGAASPSPRSSAEERPRRSPGTARGEAAREPGEALGPEQCPYCLSAISADGDPVTAKAVAEHLHGCGERPQWDLAGNMSRPSPETVYRVLHECSRRIAERTDERDLFGATDALVEAAENLYRAFGHEPPMKDVSLGELRVRPEEDATSWLTRIRSVLPFEDGGSLGKRS